MAATVVVVTMSGGAFLCGLYFCPSQCVAHSGLDQCSSLQKTKVVVVVEMMIMVVMVGGGGSGDGGSC